MINVTYSVNNIPIRLSDERWVHIIENHDDLAGYYDEILSIVEHPDYIIKGYSEALIALKQVGKSKFLAVVYKEVSDKDGFILTAYFTSKIKLEKEAIIWQRQK